LYTVRCLGVFFPVGDRRGCLERTNLHLDKLKKQIVNRRIEKREQTCNSSRVGWGRGQRTGEREERERERERESRPVIGWHRETQICTSSRQREIRPAIRRPREKYRSALLRSRENRPCISSKTDQQDVETEIEKTDQQLVEAQRKQTCKSSRQGETGTERDCTLSVSRGLLPRR
jgi:hypothetical protein